ncbi:MAG: HugZ family protein [Saezia sp.]
MSDSQHHSAQIEIDKLHDHTKTLILSTMDKQGELETSYSPYLFDQGYYYFLASDLAPHSENMKNHLNISFLLIEDEGQAKNIYARARLSYKATVSIIDKKSDEYTDITTKLRQRTGKTVDLLLTINDFNLYKIHPSKGRLVIGFGKAYLINAETNEIIHVDKDYIQQQKS